MIDLSSKQRAARIREIFAEICNHKSVREIPLLLECIQDFRDTMFRWMGPVWDGVQRPAEPGQVDRHGSSIGGYPFTSTQYPWPLEDGLPLAPMLQLNLDQIRETTGLNFGSGLLQAWLPSRDVWGGVQLNMRSIPSTALAKEPSEIPEDHELIEARRTKAWKFNLQISDPDWLDKPDDEELKFHHHWGAIGFDWTLSNGERFSSSRGQESLDSNLYLPCEIKEWKKQGGCSLPPDERIERELRFILQEDNEELEGDLDEEFGEEWIEELNELCGHGKWGSLQPWPQTFWCSDGDEFTWFDEGWMPLFSFDGPMEKMCVEDAYQIYYRVGDSGFEYVGVGGREYW